mgnify:CR=1 FL=1
MKNIYNDLIGSLELMKQYLLENGGSYSLYASDTKKELESVNELFESLVNIKKGINSSVNTNQLDTYISRYLSIKYSSDYIKIAKSVRDKKTSRNLKKSFF